MTQTANSPPDAIDPAVVDEVVARHGGRPESTLAILQDLQVLFGYLPEPALRRVPETTSIRAADLMGAATFYDRFRLEPAGKHRIRVCIGTACHVKGAESVFDAFRRLLRIPDETDTDAERLFTVEKVACLGCCMLAPAVQIDDIIYGPVAPNRVGRVVEDFLAALDHRPAPSALGSRDDAAGEARLCLCSSCDASGASALAEALAREVDHLGLAVAVRAVACHGASYKAPLVEIVDREGRSHRYGRMRPDLARTVLLRHFRPGALSKRLLIGAERVLETVLVDHEDDAPIRYSADTRDGVDSLYHGRQRLLATEHAGDLDPLDLDAYISHNGFSAWSACVGHRTPEEVIAEIEKSGLRGRGGAGFPTGRKWRTVRDAPGDRKAVILNADEGDPGAFMDRMLLESFPFRIFEGLAIAAWAVGAERAVVYVRAEYPLAVKRLRQALRLCEEKGFLGASVRGTDWSAPVEIHEGAGAFVCGEETALIAAVEGRRGTPRFRPPYPAIQGLHGWPTLVNNAETLALVPWILRNGAGAFAAIGTEGSKGTKTFALAGKIERGGLIETPMGLTLREIVEEIGGGAPGGRIKAVQVGGPSGGCVPASLLDTPVDYEHLREAGAIMGSGGMVVLDDSDCMVDVARYFLAFTQRESCGQCAPCRVGTRRMLEILERLCEGRARKDDVDQLERLAHDVSRLSLCGLGRTAPTPVLSTLRYFREEVEAHVAGRCPAKRCRALVTYRITGDCIGCTRCAQRCPAEAIAPRPYEKHVVDDDACIRCDTCRQVCPVDAVKVE